MKKIAVFPGSFDPITKGHQNIINRAIPLFDEVIVAIGTNTSKNYYYSLDQRIKHVTQTFSSSKVTVETYTGLTVDFCKAKGANFILRGIRNSIDFSYEKNIAHMNETINQEIETVILLTAPEYAHINSTIVRELLKNKADVSAFIPEEINKNDL